MMSFDNLPISDIYKKEGASPAALRFLGGNHANALYHLWRAAIMDFRSIPASEGDTYHVKDGNEQLPMAFAKRLDDRIKLNHPITAIKRDANSVTVTYREYGNGRGKRHDSRCAGKLHYPTGFQEYPGNAAAIARKAVCG